MNTALITALIIHPAAAALPMPGDADPTVRAVIASICDLGRVTDPLKISKGRIVDGRIRLRGAVAAGLEAVPVVEIAESEVGSIILHSLLARRHLTKSGLAYMGYPLLEAALAESRKRRLENLKSAPPIPGASSVVSASESRSSTQWTIGNTAEELAASLGISRSFFFMAREIHKKFASSPRTIRQEWEPKILSGEMGLGEVQQAIAGKLAALNGQTTPKNDPQILLFDLFSKAKVRFARWESLDKQARAAALENFRTEFLPSLPAELLEEAERFIAAHA